MYIKWAGGKRKLAPSIMEIAESRGGGGFPRLTEPFAGGAAFSCYYRSIGGRAKVRLYDVNEDLINLHRCVAGGRLFFSEFVGAAWNTFRREDYRVIRDTFNSRKMSENTQAAMFLWMNKFGFNGLCRYNSDGMFNVPVGKQTSDPKAPLEAMNQFAAYFRHDVIETAPFTDTMTLGNSIHGELFYCDPPYLGMFSGYTAKGFGCDEHIALAQAARTLADNGRKVMISNSLCDDTLSVYGDADEIVEVNSMQSISRDSGSRGAIREVVALYGF